MKQSTLTLIIILLLLITLILTAAVALLVLVNNQSDAPVTDATLSVSVTVNTHTPSSTPSTTTAPQTTNPPTTSAPKPTTTTVPVTDTPKPTTTTAPVTNAPVTDAPVTDEPKPPETTQQPACATGTINGDEVGALSIHADYAVLENSSESSTAKVRFTVYIYCYSIQLGARSDNYMTVNGQIRSSLETAAIYLPSGTPKTRTVLYDTVLEIEKTDGGQTIPFDVEFYWHFKGSYSGVAAEWASVKIDCNIAS